MLRGNIMKAILKSCKLMLVVVLILCLNLLMVGCTSDEDAAVDAEGGETPNASTSQSDNGGGGFWGSLLEIFSGEVYATEVNHALEESERGDSDQTWAVYWYLCGSDLESGYGAASTDINEMLEVSLPENVQVVIQTGGATRWQDHNIDEDSIGRYLYSSDGFELVDEQPQANMGDPDTLSDFLRFCEENYPADKSVVLFWNHGGGSVTGAAFDENYQFDSLTLDEFEIAFKDVYTPNSENPPIELVGFDTCLMATIDVAHTFRDLAHYLVASEELEPGNGWNYSGFLQALADDPAMGGAQLGRAICDSYAEGCQASWTEGEITLSVTDLTCIDPLLKAYDAMGREALVTALDSPMFFSTFGREAGRSESYGGNTDEQGYTNMVDLGHLVRNSQGLLPETSQAVLDGLEECVVYRVNGPYRTEATGLSCYYSYNKDVEDFTGYTNVGYSESFKYLYGYGIGGSLSSAGMQYINGLGYQSSTLPEIPTLETETPEEGFPVTVDDEGFAVLDVGPEMAEMLQGVYFQLAYLDEEEDIVLMLGRDNDLDADWENGVFMDNFRGVWGAIDDYLVYMEIVYEGEDYNTYSVPILLNGEEYNLRVVYDFNEEEYHILGARQGLDDTGMADKNLRQLRVGDEITTIHYAATLSGEDDFQEVEIDTFTITEDTEFHEMDMGDGEFMMMFELEDCHNQTAWSQPVFFEVDGDDIYTTIYE